MTKKIIWIYYILIYYRDIWIDRFENKIRQAWKNAMDAELEGSACTYIQTRNKRLSNGNVKKIENKRV